MADSILKVRGEATVTGQPDEGELTIQLTQLGTDADYALAAVAERSEKLGELLDELEIDPSDRSTSGVSVREEQEWDKDSGKYYHRGYRATNRLDVTVRDISKIGALIQGASSRAHAEIGGLTWRMDLDNPARTEACREAAAEAKRKAEAYASALGVRLGSVLDVIEPGLGGGGGSRGMVHTMYDSAGDAGPDLEIEAGEIEVSATVDVTFRLEQG